MYVNEQVRVEIVFWIVEQEQLVCDWYFTQMRNAFKFNIEFPNFNQLKMLRRAARAVVYVSK